MSAIPVTQLTIDPIRGMDQRWRAQPSSAEIITDMTWNEQDSWMDGPGYRRIVSDYVVRGSNDRRGTIVTANAFDSESIITSLHWFAQHNGSLQYTVWETSAGELKVFNGSEAPSDIFDYMVDRENNAFNGSARSRTYTATPNTRTQSFTYGGRLYLLNGKDEPVVFDGRKADSCGFFSPAGVATPFMLDKTNGSDPIRVSDSDIGAGPAAETTYDVGFAYKITFVNERGQESPASSDATSVVYKQFNATTKKIIPVAIPTGPAGCVARRIYRSLNRYSGGELILGYGSDVRTSIDNYYFHSEIQDNVTEVFTDIIPDGLLGAVLDESQLGSFPFNASISAVFKNTVFVGGMTSNEVRFSRPLNPEVFPEDNVFQIGDSTLGPVAALYPTKNALVVFKQRGIYLIKGDPNNGFYAQTLTLDAGCSAPRTVVELPGLGLAFLSEAGVYLLEGALTNTGNPTRVVKLTSPIPDLIDTLNKSALLNASAAIDRNSGEYLLSIPTQDKPDPMLLLKYHYEVGEWSTSENCPINCMVTSGDHRGYVYFGSWDSTDMAGIYVISRGWEDKGGLYSIDPSYTSAYMDFGTVYQSVHPIRFNVYAIGYGNNDIECNFSINRELDAVYSTARSHDQRYPLDTLPVYGTATFGGSTKGVQDRFSDHRPVVVRFDISASHKGPVHELQATFSAQTRRIQIVNYNIEVKGGIQRKPKPMTLSYGGNTSR